MTSPPPDDVTIGSLLGRLRESGESAFNSLSEQLLENPTFMSAFRRAAEAKAEVDRTVSGTLDFMNVPSKNDVQRLLEELGALSGQVARQQKVLLAIERTLSSINTTLADLVARGTPPASEG